MEGITKESLEQQRDQLIIELGVLETSECDCGTIIHTALADKAGFKSGINRIKNRVTILDALILACVELEIRR